MRLYIAGPMSGIPQFNFPAFDFAAQELRRVGHEVISPAELDEPEERDAALSSDTGGTSRGGPGIEGAIKGATWEQYLERDLRLIVPRENCEGIVLLEGWQHSVGACFEAQVITRLDRPAWAFNAGTYGLGARISPWEIEVAAHQAWINFWQAQPVLA